MKSLLAALVAFMLASALLAERITVGDTHVTFEPPEGFSSLPQNMIDLRWPSNRAPRWVVGNEVATTTVAYDLKPHALPADKLAEVRDSFTALFQRLIPGLEWNRNEIIEQRPKYEKALRKSLESIALSDSK